MTLSLDAFAVVIAAAWIAGLWIVAHLYWMDEVRPRRAARRAWGVRRRPSLPAQVAGGLAEVLRRARDDLVRWGTR